MGMSFCAGELSDHPNEFSRKRLLGVALQICIGGAEISFIVQRIQSFEMPINLNGYFS